MVVILLGKGGKDGNIFDFNKIIINFVSLLFKWLGVCLLFFLLVIENKDNSIKLWIMLGEVCVVVYFSFLVFVWFNL